MSLNCPDYFFNKQTTLDITHEAQWPRMLEPEWLEQVIVYIVLGCVVFLFLALLKQNAKPNLALEHARLCRLRRLLASLQTVPNAQTFDN